jgi:hypothetical protein
MSLIPDRVKELFGKAAGQPGVPPKAVPLLIPVEQRRPIVVDEDYISIRLRSLRVVNARKGTGLYYGCVHSFVKLLAIDTGDAEFRVVTSPDKLRKLDAKNLNRVLVRDLDLLQRVPYRGQLQIEVGLFSIKSADLIAPYLDLLQTISNKAGVGFVSQAMTFAEPIKTGINLLLGAGQDVELEVGLQEGFSIPETGSYVLIRTANQQIDATALTMDSNNELHDASGKLLTDYPYIVFTIEASKTREDWFKIPEVKKAHEGLMSAIKARKFNEAENDAFPTFRRTCLTSSDLLFDDALQLVQKQEAKLKVILQAQQVAAVKAPDVWSLRSLDLYNSGEPEKDADDDDEVSAQS